MRNFIAIGLCCLSFGSFMGCTTLSEDPIERARQVEFYKQEAIEYIDLITTLVVDEESLAELRIRSPKKYVAAEFAFDRVLRRLEFAGEEELVITLQDLWDKLFEEEI